MPGTHLSLHHFVKAGKVKLEGCIHLLGGIHLLGRRSKDILCADRTEQFSVALDITGILRQILFVVKLRRVHEDRNDTNIVLFHCSFDERCVPLMQGPHSGYQANRFACLFALLHGGLQILFCGDNFHIYFVIFSKKHAKIVKIPRKIKFFVTFFVFFFDISNFFRTFAMRKSVFTYERAESYPFYLAGD